MGALSWAASNQELFARAMSLWALPGARVLDVTFGRGVFWRDVPPGRYRVVESDLLTGTDLRALPYTDACADVVVLDPPYRWTAERSHGDPTDHQYAGERTLQRASGASAVLDLYVDGLVEAHRVLGWGGVVLVKCQDTTDGGRQRWMHVELLGVLERLGMPAVDLGVVVSSRVPPTRYGHQRTLRKAHSYLLVGRKGGWRPHGQGPSKVWLDRPALDGAGL